MSHRDRIGSVGEWSAGEAASAKLALEPGLRVEQREHPAVGRDRLSPPARRPWFAGTMGTSEGTSVSLLEKLRDRSDDRSWQRLVDLYAPLIAGWLRRYAVAQQDAEDLSQEVLATVAKEIPEFRHSGRTGAFRAWLRTITVYRLRAFWRSRSYRPQSHGGSDFEKMLEQLEDPRSGLSRLWDEEHDRHVTERLLQLVEPEFEPSTWQAFQGVVNLGRKPAEVAAELQMSVNAVLIAKSRVLRRLRSELQGLVDEDAGSS